MTVWVVLSTDQNVVVFEYMEDAVEFVNNAVNRSNLRIIRTEVIS